MRFSQRVQSLPPYLFAGIERKIAERRAAGADVISLGIGDPDLPTPPHIVRALAEGAADPATHQYPSNQGELAFREAVAGYYATRFGVALDPATQVMPLLGAKEGIAHIGLAMLDQCDVALATDPGYPVYTTGPLLADGTTVLAAAGAGTGLPARPGRYRAERPRQGEDDIRGLPQQPHGRRHRGRLLRPARGLRPRTRPARRPRQRLRRHHLRRLRGAQLPADAGRTRRGRRDVQLVEELQHDGMAFRSAGREH